MIRSAVFFLLDWSMRPEYIEAVDAVRFGWSLWLTFLLPAAIIWYAVFAQHCSNVEDRAVIGCGRFAVACVVFYGLALIHVERLQSAKELHMRTAAEQMDFASDTWRVFARVTVIPVAVVFCMANLIGANLAHAGIKWYFRRRAVETGSRSLKNGEEAGTS